MQLLISILNGALPILKKNYYNEDIKMFEIADGQTKEQAILGPKNCMSSREPNGSAKFANFCGKAEGKKICLVCFFVRWGRKGNKK